MSVHLFPATYASNLNISISGKFKKEEEKIFSHPLEKLKYVSFFPNNILKCKCKTKKDWQTPAHLTVHLAPRAKNHAELIMNMAMDMRDAVCFVKVQSVQPTAWSLEHFQDPRPGTDTHIKIRLGSHSGQVSKKQVQLASA